MSIPWNSTQQSKGMNPWHMWQRRWISRKLCWMNKTQKVTFCMIPFNAFLKWQKYKIGEQISCCQGSRKTQGGGEGRKCSYKRATNGSWGSWKYSLFDWSVLISQLWYYTIVEQIPALNYAFLTVLTSFLPKIVEAVCKECTQNQTIKIKTKTWAM